MRFDIMSVPMNETVENDKLPLAELLPQADPMILLTDYEPPAREGSVDAFVTVSSASPFFEPSLGGVPACVTLEYMAQTMALCTGFYRRARNLPPQVGFLLGSRRLTVSVPCFKDGETYRVHAECTYSDESFGSFDCTVTDAAGTEVARGALTAFQPDGEVTPETMEAYT